MSKKIIASILYSLLIVFILILLILILRNLFFNNNSQKEILNSNLNSIKINIENLEKNNEKSLITFSDISNFKWDEVYIFAPYTDEKYCREVLNIKDNIFLGSYGTDDETKVIFMNNGNVVCLINGVTENLKFNISFDYGNCGNYIKINYLDDDYAIDLETNYINEKHYFLYVRKYGRINDYNSEISKYYGEWKNMSNSINMQILNNSIIFNENKIDNLYVNIEYINSMFFKNIYNVDLKDFGLTLDLQKSFLELNISSNNAINNICKFVFIDKNKMLMEKSGSLVILYRKDN